VKSAYVLAGLIGLSFPVALLGPLGFRFNLTRSLPLGIYRVAPGPPVRGSIVNVCLGKDIAEFARTRGYIGPGSCSDGTRPVGKLVLAVGGDLVTHLRDEIRVNGNVVANSRTASKDSRSRPLPHHPWGNHRLSADELWLFSPFNDNAFDSRYFGPVKHTQVVAVLRPLWTRLPRVHAIRG
jgi:conjugative transfer signal peptidase TraF